jgi:D-glycero-alpha-D-manno-heptose-7-phosphate kinase
VIICRTPLRMSLFGGGTDYPQWYTEHGGAVLSTTINKYSYINLRWLPPFFDYKYRIRYFNQEQVNYADEILHPSVRECIKFLKINGGIEVVHNADLPARSGLGSSSAFTVGMLHSLYTLMNYMPSKKELAMNAINIEQNLIKESVGSQDQVAAAFGGLNFISFDKNSQIDVEKIVIPVERISQLESNLLMFFTGFARTASEIAKIQIEEIDKNERHLNLMSEICLEGKNILINSNADLNELGKLLDMQWDLKKRLAKEITNPEIDDIYNAGIENGALGGKLLGAGGGGFIVFYAEKEFHSRIKSALKEKLFVPIRFDYSGSKIVYYSHD